MKTFDQHYIGGQWVKPTTSDTTDVYDSVTEEVMATVPAGSAADVDAAVAAAQAAFPSWSATPVEERAKYLTRIGDALGARMDELATTISKETGMAKWLSQLVQVGLPINSFNQAAAIAESFAFEEEQGNSLDRARADRRRRLHHAVELPAPPDRGQDRVRHGRRLHGRAEAE